MPPIASGCFRRSSTARRQSDRLQRPRRARPGYRQERPSFLAISTWSAQASAAGLCDRDGGVGCTIVGSTGMHMRLAMTPDRVQLNSERSGYTMAFPVPGTCAQMQSNMASTLNIDWLLDLAREILATADVERSRRDLLAGMDDSMLAAAAGTASLHPYISQAGERGSLSRARRPRTVHGPAGRRRLFRSHARRL